MANVDRHKIIPTVGNGLRLIQRYADNLYIFKTEKFVFNNTDYHDSHSFWKRVFDFLLKTSKNENLDTSLSLQRGIYPDVETLFLNLRFPYLRDDNFNVVNPMLFDVSARPQFGLNTPYILEFHDIEGCIDYLKHLWIIDEDVDVNRSDLAYEERLRLKGKNTFELNCISVRHAVSFSRELSLR